MDSILTSIKKLLGITESYTHFDADILLHLNSVFATLPQICPLCPAGFRVSGVETTWDEYLADRDLIEFVKTYVYLKVRIIFDPPTGAVLDAMKQTAQELEWRLSIAGNAAEVSSEPDSGP